MSAARNISSEASSGAAEKIGGLLTAHPAAPMAGRNSGPIWKRVCGSWPHQPDNLAGTRIQIFVRAPHGEIDIPLVQLQRQVADGMRHVEPGDGADPMRGTGN